MIRARFETLLTDFPTPPTLRIRRKESVNQMSVSNLSIVFGPTLLGAPASMGGMNLEHMSFQCKVSVVHVVAANTPQAVANPDFDL